MDFYKLLVCDVNNSNLFIMLDMIRICKLILMIMLDFGDGGVDSWQFFNGDVIFFDFVQLWLVGLCDNSFIFILEFGFCLFDFIVVKLGDVNGNVIVD